MKNEDRKRVSTLILLLGIPASIGAGYLWLNAVDFSGLADRRFIAWLVGVGLTSFWFTVLGWGWRGVPSGVLIDVRKKYSLSQLQLTAWTALILPALCVATLSNLAAGGDFSERAMEFNMPTELWALMGISVAGLAGSQIIKAAKLTPRPTMAFEMNDTIEQANIWDIFEREEDGGTGMLDLGKVQMFFVSAILIILYGVLLGEMFLGGLGVPIAAADAEFLVFPAIDDSIVAFLAISHGGYLATKAGAQPQPLSGAAPPAATDNPDLTRTEGSGG